MKKRFLLCFLLLCFGIFLVCKVFLFSNQKQIFKTYKEVREELLCRNTEKVSIAIIDSGIEKKYLSSCTKCIDFTGEKIKYDYTGHGTKMYEIIQSPKYGIAPYTNVYILRVTNSAGNTEVSNVIRAIKWCVENDINIISFSMATSDDNKILHKELEDAYKSGIHIFSAVSNTSCYVSYPAAYDEVIGVYSGKKQKFYDNYHYFFVSLDKYEISENVSGNSPATAFCAAIAAYYLSNSNDRNKNISNTTLLEKIRGVLEEW